MSLIEKIANNDAGLTKLVLDDIPMEYFGRNEVSKLTNALDKNTVIESVRLEKDFLACLHSDRDVVVESLAKLKNLKEVFIGDTTIQVLSIAHLLDNCKTLRTLSLDHITFQGIQPDFNQFELSLYKHFNLKTFDLGKYSCALGDEIIMDGVKALNHEPNLASKLDNYRHSNPAAFAA